MCQRTSERVRLSEAGFNESRGRRDSRSHCNGDTRSVQITRVRAVPQQKKRDRLETGSSWPTDRTLAPPVAEVGAVYVVGAVAKAVAAAEMVDEITVGAAVQVAKEPQAHAENLAKSATAAGIFGVIAQNYYASVARRRDTAQSIARARRTWR